MRDIQFSNKENTKLYTNSINVMNLLGIIDDTYVYHHLKRHELRNYMAILLTNLNCNINIRCRDITTKLLIIVYYSLCIVYLENRCNKKNKYSFESIQQKCFIDPYSNEDIYKLFQSLSKVNY